MTATIDAIVIAGGKIHDPALARIEPVSTKAQIELLGRPLIWWLVEALKACGRIERVVCVGAASTRNLVPNADVFLEEREDETENIFAGIEALSPLPDRRILMSAGDTPLLTSESLQDLIDNSPDADAVFPIIGRNEIRRAFPSRRWIFARLVEGEFTGANCFLFKPEKLILRREWLSRILAVRRSLPRLVGLLGAGIMIKYVTRRLYIADLENRAFDVLGITARAYISGYPELAMDIDHPADIEIAREWMAARLKG